ncbi:MAG TPA: MotA/TolQ/ExbB proton channel family protein [Vicinamibacterales bacterium]|nr:MotA/TolQ/ExbB proton channel family protein [Vicinamibacterales bacterium]
MRSLGSLILAFQDSGRAPGASEPGLGNSTDITTLILNADPVVKLVLITLVLFSAVSWGVILFKQSQLRRAAKQTATFLDVFRKSSRFSEVQAVCTNLGASPLVALFQAGYAELNTQLRSTTGEAKPATGTARPTLRSLDAVDRALLRASTSEVAKLEHRVPFLATTASLTPYIGLFGTVWGIMAAFQGIASAGSTSLGVVAPPIAEALVATAAGLFAAIPAVYFYNDLTSQIKKVAGDMEDFSMEFLTIAERNFT